MKILKCENKLCFCCMETHDVKTVLTNEIAIFKGVEVSFVAESIYCDRAEEWFEDERMMRENGLRIKDAYRKKMSLLTADEIIDVRNKYDISQTDMCVVLGWGEKTIARYETHQVQDKAHDAILRKIDQDPKWFMQLLIETENSLPEMRFKKYLEVATSMYEEKQDAYLQEAIKARYIRFMQQGAYNGNAPLDLDKIVDVICYFANSTDVNMLYKVKLMKLLWYADALAYKTRGRAMTGLVYQAMPMGAVPIAHDIIMQLKGVPCETIENGDNISYKLNHSNNTSYTSLSEEEKQILDKVIAQLGKMSKDEIVDFMHKELAYEKTEEKAIINFKYAEALSI